MRGVRVARAVWLAAALLVSAAAKTVAQTPDVSGTWQLTVTTDQGVTHPRVTFRQDGEALTGEYDSERLGLRDVVGEVSGSIVRWTFDASAQGQSFPVRYRGTLQDDGTLEGTIDIAGGMLTGRFTAVRSGAGG